jgi:hypothetical protein
MTRRTLWLERRAYRWELDVEIKKTHNISLSNSRLRIMGSPESRK